MIVSIADIFYAIGAQKYGPTTSQDYFTPWRDI
jgi:hypothetical protein